MSLIVEDSLLLFGDWRIKTWMFALNQSKMMNIKVVFEKDE